MNTDLELYYKEYDTLRQELNHIKRDQFSLVQLSVTATSVLLGLGWKERSNIPFSVACLFPLIILIPFWHIFFDKATTVTRLVGYLRVLEKIIISPNLVRNHIGWENALVVFRRLQQDERKERNHCGANCFWIKDFRLFAYLTSARYWGLYYLVFFFMSWLCISLSFSYGYDSSLFLFIVAATFCITLFSSLWNAGLFCQLVWGMYTYDVNESLWKKIMFKTMILDRERLMEKSAEYKGGQWRSKALNFEGGMDFSDYDTLLIKANIKGGGRYIKIQLLDSFEPEVINSPRGLSDRTYFVQEEIKPIQIPLSEFKEINLKMVQRLAIHYGDEMFGKSVNPSMPEAAETSLNVEEIKLQ